jgi:CHAD domain-containing protein
MGKKIQKAICIFGAKFLLKQVNALESEMEGALVGNDIEYVHRMRVASRRLRNGLDCFKDCLPAKKFKKWQDEIRKTTRALGTARDLDVQIELLNHLYDDNLDTQYKPGYSRLLLRLKQRRTKAQKKIHKRISKLRDRDILKKMQIWLEEQTADLEDIYLYTPSLYQRAFIAINDKLEEFLSYQQDILSPENIDHLHAMRIAGKHLRYTLEIFAPIYDKAVLPHVQVMKHIQDQLGVIHDNDVWVTWLPKFIDKEQTRVEDYFGSTGPFIRLRPGLEYLIEDRKKVRAGEYQSFISYWQNLQTENAWAALRDIIKAPIDIEAAVEHIASEEAFEADDAAADVEDDVETEGFETNHQVSDLEASDDPPIQTP